MSENGGRYTDLMVAGFGGQGALIIGRLIADTAMSLYPHVSFFPNYGASARGGDTECTIILSDEEISSPALLNPMTAILMGKTPLIQEFEKRTQPGGIMMIDSSLVDEKLTRSDLRAYYIPATKAAADLGSNRVANFIFLGAYLEATKAVPVDDLMAFLEKKVGGGGDNTLLALDRQAMDEGARLARENQ
jgi:2-oxoglutarate ferredoxin oxidoreductase subunit gamma